MCGYVHMRASAQGGPARAASRLTAEPSIQLMKSSSLFLSLLPQVESRLWLLVFLLDFWLATEPTASPMTSGMSKCHCVSDVFSPATEDQPERFPPPWHFVPGLLENELSKLSVYESMASLNIVLTAFQRELIKNNSTDSLPPHFHNTCYRKLNQKKHGVMTRFSFSFLRCTFNVIFKLLWRRLCATLCHSV